MRSLKKIFFAFTKNERLLFVFAAAGTVVSFIIVIGILFAHATTDVPTAGGHYTEGFVGQPEYVNPVIASSEADLDLVKMVYSNLSDLADSVSASPDLKTWTVRLKENLTWQDGQQLTSDDVVFTVQNIQDPDSHSPLAASWQGVTASRVSELEVQFTLANPYAFFADNLKDLYIIPKHLYAETPPGNWHLSDYNLKPVGSGPYEFTSYDKGSDGFIASYNLSAWSGYDGPKPLIQDFTFHYFENANDLVQSFNAGQVDGFGDVSPQDIATINRPDDLFVWPTTGYYAVFFDQSNNLALQDPVVRQALSAAIDRNALVTNALGGNGTPEYGPVPQDAAYFAPIPATTSSADFAESLLDADGWTVGANGVRSKTIATSPIPLVVNLTVPQIDFLAATADALRTAWQAIGVQVNILPDSTNDIVANDITNRSYEALLFGNILGPSSDLYSFWDSSQRFSPGLNLSIYSDPKVDALIEAARASTSSDVIAGNMASAQTDIAAAYPAIFLYSPDYTYVANKNVQGITTNILVDPSDRFRDISTWYLDTARILK